MYIVLSRYERISHEGKEFTDWFVLESKPMTKEKAEQYIKDIKENFNSIDVKTKLKHEYMLKNYDEYVKERNQKVENNKILEQKNKEYYKSAEYKELMKKKRQAAKEHKERQKKYLEEHSK